MMKPIPDAMPMNVKWLILPVTLAVGLGAVYFLPSVGEVAQSAIRMELPEDYQDWVFQYQKPSEKEIEALASDTKFSKAICYRRRPLEFLPSGNPNYDRLDLSIVLSGVDINNSIHRPERCMPAQGHRNLVGSDVPIRLSNDRTLVARRLTSIQDVAMSEDRNTKEAMRCVTYYFFVGHDRIAHGHYERTFIDMKDRLVRGMDQRWAYVSVSMWYGKMPWNPSTEITEEEADEKISSFLGRFVEEQVDWEKIP
jgi:hypothetical protein